MQDSSLRQKALGASAAGLSPDFGLDEFGLQLPGMLTAADSDQLLALGLDVSAGEQLSVDTWGGTDVAACPGEAWLVGSGSGSGSVEEGSGTPVAVSSAKDKLEQTRAQNRAKQARFRQRQKVGRWGSGHSCMWVQPPPQAVPARPADRLRAICCLPVNN